ncbi:alpha/beta hydrolase [Candidatus Parcubacteria bacterium]|nr:alpha/beta hydrolase [Candidatus Parcubacteria bacterium]
MKKRVAIHYAWGEDRGETRWLFWLEKQLQKLGVEVSIQPVDSQQFRGNWIHTLQKDYAVTDDHIFTLEHDPGCLTILKYIEYLKNHDITDTHLLVAGTHKGHKGAPGPYIRLESSKELMIFSGAPASEMLQKMNAHLIVLYSAVPEQIEAKDRARIQAGSRSRLT